MRLFSLIFAVRFGGYFVISAVLATTYIQANTTHARHLLSIRFDRVAITLLAGQPGAFGVVIVALDRTEIDMEPKTGYSCCCLPIVRLFRADIMGDRIPWGISKGDLLIAVECIASD